MQRIRGGVRVSISGSPTAVLARLGTVPVLDLRSRQPSLEEIFRNCSVTPTARSLGGPFAWRSTEGMLAAWLTGILACAVTIGVLLSTVTDFLARDPSHRQMLQTLGMDVAETTDGYLGVMAVLLGPVIALYAACRIGAARGEEAAGRLEQLLT